MDVPRRASAARAMRSTAPAALSVPPERSLRLAAAVRRVPPDRSRTSSRTKAANHVPRAPREPTARRQQQVASHVPPGR